MPFNRYLLHLFRASGALFGTVLALFCLLGTTAALSAYPPPLVLQTGSSSLIRGIALAPSGDLIATASEDHSITIWNPKDGTLIRTLRKHQASVNAVAFSPDCRILVSASDDGTLGIWEAESGEFLAALPQGAAVKTLTLARHGTIAVASDALGRVAVWDLESRHIQHILDAKTQFIFGAVMLDDDVTFALLTANAVQIWDIHSGTLLRTIRLDAYTKDRSALSIAVRSGDGVLAIGLGGTSSIMERQNRAVVLLLSPRTGALETRIEFDTPEDWGAGHVSALAFEPLTGVLLVGTWGGRIFTIASENGAVLADVKAYPSMVTALLILPDGKAYASAGGDPRDAGNKGDTDTISVKLWALADNSQQLTLPGTSNAVAAVSFSASDRYLLVESEDRMVKLWDLKAGSLSASFEGAPGNFAPLSVLSPDERSIITAVSKAGVSGLAGWDLSSQSQTWWLPHPHRGGGFESVSFNTAGSALAAAECCSFPEYVDIIDASGHVSASFPVKTPLGLVSAVFSRDDTTLALAGTWNWHTDIHDAHTGRYRRTIEKAYGPTVFLDDDSILSTTGPGASVAEWKVSTGKQTRVYPRPRRTTAFAFQRKLGLVAAADEAGEISIWDRGVPRAIAAPRIIKIDTPIRSLAFNSDGSLLAVGAKDSSVIVVSLGSGEILLRLFATKDGDWLAVAPDGLFDGTAGGINLVAWRPSASNVVVPLEAFFNDYYRPGLLTEIARGARPRATVDIAAVVQLPGLRAMLAQGEAHTEMRGQDLVVCFKQAPGAVLAISPTDRRAQIPAANGFSTGPDASCPYQKILSDERVTEADLKSWRAESDSTPWDGQKSETKGSTLHVLTVGVSQYGANSGLPPLPYATESARRVAASFKAHGATDGSPYAAVRIWDGLYDGSASKDGISDRLREMSTTVAPGDVVVLYFAGHGVSSLGQEMFYFVPVDGREGDLRHTAISTAWLADNLRRLPSRRVMVFLDTCQSGAALEALGKIAIAKARIAELGGDTTAASPGVGVHIVAATLPLSYAVGLPRGQSALSVALIDALGEGRSASELEVLLQKTVPAASAKIADGFTQTPIVKRVGVDFALP